MATANETLMAELYTAYFNRAPDAAGLAYWVGELQNGTMDFGNIASNWANEQQEFINTYGANADTTALITSVYSNVLGRSPDTAGTSYWTAELASGNIPMDQFVLAIVNGAKATTGSASDAALLNNKAEIGIAFAERGIENVELARDIMSLVTSDASSTDAANVIITMIPVDAALLTPTLLTSITGVIENVQSIMADAPASLANMVTYLEMVATQSSASTTVDMASVFSAINSVTTSAVATPTLLANAATLASSTVSNPTTINTAITNIVTPPAAAAPAPDTTAPTVTLTYSVDGGSTYTSTVSTNDGDTLKIKATFSEAIEDATGATIAVDNTVLSSTAMTKVSTTVYTYDLNVPAGDIATATVTIGAAKDAANNVISAAATNNTFTVDNTAPTTTAALGSVTDNVGSITGALTTGGVSDDTSLVLAGTVSLTLVDGEVVAVYDGATKLGNATVMGTDWTYTDTTLANTDTPSYTVQVEDAAVNHSAATAAFTATIDTVAPTVNVPSATDDVGSVTGALTSGDTTDDTALALAGTCESGSTVEVFDGTTSLGTATVVGTNWTYSATIVNGTTYQLNVKETDEAGNISAAAADFTVVGDTTAPASTTTSTAFNENTGVLTITGTNFDTILESAENATTDVKGRLDWTKLSWDINGDNGTTTDVSFTASDITSAKVTDATTLTITLTNAKVAALLGTIGYNTTGASAADTIDITAGFIVDSAGNAAVGDALVNGTLTITSDTTAPTTTAALGSVTDNVGSITGALTTGGVSDDTSLVLAGTVSLTLVDGEVVAVYDGATKLGNATVMGTDWTYTDTTLANTDTPSYTVQVEDAAVNHSAATAAFTATIDTVAPTVNVVSVTNATTISLTVDEASIAGLYDSTSALVGSAATMAANVANTITVAAQSSITGTQLYATDAAGNNTGSVVVGLGTTGDDSFTFSNAGTAGNDFIFGFDGNDEFDSGAGNDTLIGSNGTDTFLFTSDNFTTDDIIDGGEANALNTIRIIDAATIIDEDFTNVTDVGQISLNGGLTHSITLGANASSAFTYTGVTNKLGIGIMNGGTATSLTVDASATTIGITVDNKPNNGDAGVTEVTGGSGDDMFIFGSTGASSIHFADTAVHNGNDSIYTADAAHLTMNFSSFLSTTSANTAAVDFVASGLDLSGVSNLGIVYNKGTLSNMDIATSTASSKIAVADNGKAVALCSSATDTSTASMAWGIYYIEDTDTTGSQTWSVTLVGQILDGTGSTVTGIEAITFA